MLCVGRSFVRMPLPGPRDQPNSASRFLLRCPCLSLPLSWPDKEIRRRPPLLIVHDVSFLSFPKNLPPHHLHRSSPHAHLTSLAAAPAPLPALPNGADTASSAVSWSPSLLRACSCPTTPIGAAVMAMTPL
jgi:hypothetical protein